MSCVVAVVILWSTTLDLSRQAGTTGAQVAAGESVAGRSSAARELPPALAWPNYAVMPDVNASTSAGIQGEVSIAIDAAQPTRAVAASMDLRGAGILVMASNDRGRTWSRHSLPRGEGASFHADPMVDFDSRGVAHLAHIPVANGNVPLGIEVTRSFDGGHTWTPAQRISANRGRDDKVILRADNNLASLYRDRVYVAWKWPPGGVYVSRSTDRGVSFSAPLRIDEAVISGLDMVVAADGTVYLAANERSQRRVRVWRSDDGGDRWVAMAGPTGLRAGWYTSTPSHCTRMSLVHASLAVDRSDSTRRGNVYLSWSDAPPGSPAECSDACEPSTRCTANVCFSSSVDRGASWSAAVTVHEEELGDSDQYHQWMKADPRDGSIYVAYKDTRHDPNRYATDVYMSRSADGGLSWEPSVRMSSAFGHARGGFQYGDYQGLAVLRRRALVAWSDYRTELAGSGEIYVSEVVFRKRIASWSTRQLPARDELEVTYHGRVRGQVTLDAYVFVADPVNGERVYLRPGGRQSLRPRAWATFEAHRKYEALLRIPLSSWAPFAGSGRLLGVQLADAGADPEIGSVLRSSRLKIPLADLLSASS